MVDYIDMKGVKIKMNRVDEGRNEAVVKEKGKKKGRSRTIVYTRLLQTLPPRFLDVGLITKRLMELHPAE